MTEQELVVIVSHKHNRIMFCKREDYNERHKGTHLPVFYHDLLPLDSEGDAWEVNTEKNFSLSLSDIIASSTLLHEDKNNLNQLTERELEIAKLVKSGWSNQKIANQLYISVNTVKKHLQSIYRKCDVQNKIQLVQKI